MSVIRIPNVESISANLPGLDKAGFVDIFTGPEGMGSAHAVRSERFRGIENLRTNKVTCIVSKHYQLAQHDEVLDAVAKALQDMNMNVRGVIRNSGDKVTLQVVFTDENSQTIRDDADGVQVGFRVVNSFDASKSIQFHMYGFRMACQNGMFLGTVVPEVRINKMHYGETLVEDLPKIATKFVRGMINHCEKLQAYVSECMEETWEWQLMSQLIEVMVAEKKHREAIMKILETERVDLGVEQLNRWQIYNAFTNYATHGEKIAPTVEEMLQNRAQQVLTNKQEDLRKRYEAKLEKLAEVSQ